MALSNTVRIALTGAMASLAREVMEHGVTVNNILPGLMDTGALQRVISDRAKRQNVPERREIPDGPVNPGEAPWRGGRFRPALRLPVLASRRLHHRAECVRRRRAFAETCSVPFAACWTLRAISCVAAPCSSTAAAIVVAISLTSPIVRPMPLIASTDSPGRPLDRGDLGGDLLGRLGGLVGERLHLAGDHGEALARLAGARRLDRRVERQQVGLAGDVADELDDVADLLRRLREALNLDVRPARLLDGLAGDPGRLGHLPADLGDRAGQLLAAVATVCTFAAAWLETAATAVVCCVVSSAVDDIDRAADCMPAAASVTFRTMLPTARSKSSARFAMTSRCSASARFCISACSPRRRSVSINRASGPVIDRASSKLTRTPPAKMMPAETRSVTSLLRMIDSSSACTAPAFLSVSFMSAAEATAIASPSLRVQLSSRATRVSAVLAAWANNSRQAVSMGNRPRTPSCRPALRSKDAAVPRLQFPSLRP